MPGIYAIGDLHLPVQTHVSKFPVPPDYFDRISQHLLEKNPEVLLLAGDLTWGEEYAEIQGELAQIRNLPGKVKFFVEGNHDVWADRLGGSYPEVQQEMYQRFSNPAFFYIGGRATIITLETNAVHKPPVPKQKERVKIGICGARGFAVDPKNPPSEKDWILRKYELESLKNAINQLKTLLKTETTVINICLLHYPPTTRVFSNPRIPDEDFFTQIQHAGIIDKIIFGHVHVDDYLQLYTRLNHIELYCTTMDRRNYNAIKVFDTKTEHLV